MGLPALVPYETVSPTSLWEEGDKANEKLTCNINDTKQQNIHLIQFLASRLYQSGRPGNWCITYLQSELAAKTKEVTRTVDVSFTKVIIGVVIGLFRFVKQVDAFR